MKLPAVWLGKLTLLLLRLVGRRGNALPGLVVALLRPDVSVTLVEPLLRRATFLTEAVATLAVANATVLELAYDVAVVFVYPRL